MRSLLTLTVMILALTLAIAALRPHGRFAVEQPAGPFPADGRIPVVLRVMPKGRTVSADAVKVRILEGANRATVQSTRMEDGRLVIRLRTGVLAGNVELEIAAAGFAPIRTSFATSVVTTDSAGDGTPDFLRLGPEDDAAFRAWFTYLAESQYFRPRARLPKEIADCAALLRFAYREALREHDGRWANELDIDDAISFPAVKKYQYPYTPLAAALFRVRDGRFSAEDLTGGAFAQFADAQTLQRLNTHRVSRDVPAAQPGDLFFYRQLDQNMPFHAMIFIGRSRFESDTAPRVVYHTGPIQGGPGEIRRPSVAMLLQHPEPKWRPVAGNSNFLGVYRWNILH